MVQDMKVAQIEYAYGFVDEDGVESKDWHDIQEICCFGHKEACEFIVYIVHDELYSGMSEQFQEECKGARDAGYKYACFYA